MLLGNKKAAAQKAAEAQKIDQSSLALQIVNRYLRWIITLVVGIVLFAGYVLVLGDMVSTVQRSARESLPHKLKVKDDLRSIKAELDEAVLDFEKIKVSKKDALERIDLLLPTDASYGDLFTTVDTVTTLSGMKLKNMTIALSDASKPQQRGRAAQEATTESDPVSQGLVRSMSIQISVEGGTYETFKQYLERLERSVRLFDVKSISFEGSSFIPNADGSFPTPSYAIELVTYYQP